MPPSPKYCNNCGVQMTDGARFCNDCGASMDSIQPTEVVPIPPPADPPPIAPTYVASHAPQPDPYTYRNNQGSQNTPGEYPPPPKAKPNQLLLVVGILGAGIVCLVVGAGLAWGLINYLSENSDEPTAAAVAPTFTATPTKSPGQSTSTTIPPTSTSKQQPPTDVPPPPTDEPPPQPTGNQVSHAETTFYYHPSLAQSVNAETVPESNFTGAPHFDIYPQHSRFEFIGYPSYPEAFHDPRILVYPSAEFAAMNPSAGDTIFWLQNLLETRPPDSPPDGLPFLPIWNAAQMMHSNMRYLDFQTGSGVRYLAQYGQSYWPINSRDLFYTFQGLTADGAYYISAIFPVANTILPDANTVVMDDAFYNNYDNYVQDIANQLNAQPDDAFIPDLSLLDILVQSLDIR